MSGTIIPRTPIAVDFWKRRSIGNARLFFLSHMHSDHTECLSSSWSQKIYCSEITKGLAAAKFDINPSLLIVLPEGESRVLPLDEEGVETLTVTAIDANHCPGSLMFLFEGYFGRILYTADFRYTNGMLDNPALNDDITQLYVDNTYCSPESKFPSRTEATLKIMEILHNHPSHDIIFGLDSLGKEELLYKVAMIMGVPIVVDSFRLKTTQLMGIASYFTTDPDLSNIRVVRKHNIRKFLNESRESEKPSIVIIPTCMYMNCFNPYKNDTNVFVVPYSDHSSFEELKMFVAAIKPQHVIPIVKRPRGDRYEASDTEKYDISVLARERSNERLKYFPIPQSVMNFMGLKRINGGQEPGPAAKKRKRGSFFGKTKKASGIVFSSPDKEESHSNDIELFESPTENHQTSPLPLPSDDHEMIEDHGPEDDVIITNKNTATEQNNVRPSSSMIENDQANETDDIADVCYKLLVELGDLEESGLQSQTTGQANEDEINGIANDGEASSGREGKEDGERTNNEPSEKNNNKSDKTVSKDVEKEDVGKRSLVKTSCTDDQGPSAVNTDGDRLIVDSDSEDNQPLYTYLSQKVAVKKPAFSPVKLSKNVLSSIATTSSLQKQKLILKDKGRGKGSSRKNLKRGRKKVQQDKRSSDETTTDGEDSDEDHEQQLNAVHERLDFLSKENDQYAAKTKNRSSRRQKSSQSKDQNACSKSDGYDEHARFCPTCMQLRETTDFNKNSDSLNFAWYMTLQAEAGVQSSDGGDHDSTDSE